MVMVGEAIVAVVVVMAKPVTMVMMMNLMVVTYSVRHLLQQLSTYSQLAIEPSVKMVMQCNTRTIIDTPLFSSRFIPYYGGM